MRGITAYAETISVYGTESVFIDGDDTPWSKAFLASAYASRGIKMRFTSGTGSEVQDGQRRGQVDALPGDPLHPPVAKGAGVPAGPAERPPRSAASAYPGRCPAGCGRWPRRTWWPAWSTSSAPPARLSPHLALVDLRRTARAIPQLFPGTHFVCSGYSARPEPPDNMFAGSNFDTEDYDDYLVVQRDWGFEGVLRPQSDDELLPLRRRAVEALRAVLDELDLARFDDADAEAVVQAHGSLDVPPLDPHLVPDAADRLMQRGLTALDVVRALAAARIRRRGRARARHAAPAALRRLPADLGHLHRGHARALGALGSERLRRARARATA